MSFLTGTSPSVSTSNYSTIGPQQQTSLQSLLAALGVNVGTGGTAASPSYSQPLTAQVTQPQTTTLNNLGSTETALQNSGATQGLGTATNTLGGIANSTPADFSSYFQNSVAQPLMQQYQQQTIPALQSAFGASSGGTNSSGYVDAVSQATNNLNNTLASNLSSTALSQYDTNQANKLSAAGQLASDSTLPTGAENTILGAQALPQTTQQSTYSNAYQEFLNQLAQNNTTNSQVLAGSTAGTMGQNQVASSGTSGLLQGLLSSVGGSSGFGSAVGNGLAGGASDFANAIASLF